MQWQVLENGSSCQYTQTSANHRWSQSIFPTFEQAQDYAMDWLGQWAPSNKNVLKPNEKFVFAQGCYIEIQGVS